ncbi:PaaI family thioesterase [Pseudarthrobacter sulfonivorans]|uniref:PaaI family thioesterase n=1 Tax=Pseudarthrobacter sulfonivorans TaxID=121292 RepID=UPI00168B0611|nr:PaaI family thioesterase [Pseudarthrobacter sulfonivorans]
MIELQQRKTAVKNFEVGPYVEYLGLELLDLSGDEVRARWDATSRLHQTAGILHGGVHCSVVETLASIGAGLWLGSKGRVVGVSNTTDFLRGVGDGQLTSIARFVHRGRTQQLWRVTTESQDGRLVATGQVRLHNLLKTTEPV